MITPAGLRTRTPPEDDICNGATDNAAGTAAVLSIARALDALPTAPRRSIVIALWDAEEDGLAGSLYYVEHPLVPLAQTVAYVNLDLIGANLLPSVSDFSFAVGAETGGDVLRGMTAAAITPSWLQTQLVSYIFGQGRSDYRSCRQAGADRLFQRFYWSVLPHHRRRARQVDFRKLRAQIRSAFVSPSRRQSDTAIVRPLSTPATYDAVDTGADAD
jgi:hypothetical protein